MLEGLVANLLRIAFHHMMLESNASEHSARMVTMKSASDNASDLQTNLTLEFNKVRQANITAEISEIVAGAEALQ
jgi:F-type H+-transporting ATPase subunit gamma